MPILKVTLNVCIKKELDLNGCGVKENLTFGKM